MPISAAPSTATGGIKQWAVSTPYVLGDYLEDPTNNRVYRALTSHTSSAIAPTLDVIASNLVQVAQDVYQWQASTAYPDEAFVVDSSGRLYKTTTNFTSAATIEADVTALNLSELSRPYHEYVAFNNTYRPGDIVHDTATEKLYRVVTKFTTTVASTVAADVTAGRLVALSPSTSTVTRLSSTQAALAPGVYDLDSSGGPFNITLTDVVGEWEFHNTERTLTANNVTLLSGGTKTFTGPAGTQVLSDFALNVDGYPVSFLHTELGNDYRTGVVSSSSSLTGPVVAGGVVFGNGTTQVQDATNLFYDDTNDRLGVGTNAPASKLTLKGNGATSPNNSGVRLSDTSGRDFVVSSRSDGGARLGISDETAGAERVSISSNGYVGLGETGPASRLHIKGDSNGDVNQASVRLQNNGAGGRSFNVGTRGDGGAQRFYVSDETAGAERFSIKDNGETYLNTSANGQLIAGIPNATLNIQAGGSNLGLNVRGNGGSSVVNIQTPTAGDATFISFKTDDGSAGAHAGSIEYFTFNNSVQYLGSSDARLKEDTGEVPAGLDELLNIKVRKYAWKRTGAIAEGFYAQELHEIVPGAVAPGTDEVNDEGALVRPWQVDYGKLTPILVKAVQDLSAKVDALTAKLEALS